jgi:hypothetical protein
MSGSFATARLMPRAHKFRGTSQGHRLAGRGIVIFMTLLAPVVALALVLALSVLEDWYEPKDSNSVDIPPG